MINLRDNEKIGYLMGWIRSHYDRDAISDMISESMQIENASEFSEGTKKMLMAAEKAVGPYDGSPLFDDNKNVWKSIAEKFREKGRTCHRDILLGKSESKIVKFNPYHDRLGRFTTAEGGTRIALATPSDWQSRGSLSKHVDLKTGKISAERQALYTDILTGLIKGVEKPEGKPRLEYMGGGGASGKSYVLNKTSLLTDVPKGNKAVQINADEIKELLPEYKQMQESEDLNTRKSAASFVHEESSMLANQAARMAIDLGYSVVIDGCAANPKKLAKETDMAKKEGYEIHAHYIAAPMEQAVKANKDRFEHVNRYVPDAVIVDAHKKVSRNFEEVANSGMFDSVEVITNEYGKSNDRIYYKEKDKPAQVSDREEYEEFLNKANYSR